MITHDDQRLGFSLKLLHKGEKKFLFSDVSCQLVKILSIAHLSISFTSLFPYS